VAAAVRTELATELARIDENVSAAKTLTSAYDAAKTAAPAADVTAIKTTTDKLATALELDGSVYRLTANALEQAPTASGSGSAADIWTYPNRGLTTGDATINVISPVSVDGEAIELVYGTDYAAADGLALSWTRSTWPDLAGASLALHIGTPTGAVTIAATATGSGTQTVTAELTAVDTAALSPGFSDFELEATLTNGHKVALVQGTCRVRPSVD